jgi:cytochrome c oxidase subunit III
MSATVLFLACVLTTAIGWLWRQGLASKPWLHVGLLAGVPGANPSTSSTAKVGLGVFLAVAGCLFALFVSAYSMRMQTVDWWPMPVPGILWLNTGVLALSSLTLEWAKACAHRKNTQHTRVSLTATFLLSLIFLVGQIAAWRQLETAGYALASNPANSFFYLITGAHGLHVLGGLVALGRTTHAAWRKSAIKEPRDLALRIDLCAIYWHFLLSVWLVVLTLLAGWAGDFIAICRQLLT